MKQNLGEEYWLALARAPGIGPINFGHLLNHFGSPRGLFEAGHREWRTLRLRTDLRRYLQKPNWLAVEKDMSWLAQAGHHLVTLEHPNYPPLLREIYQPPPLLFVEGNCAILTTLQLAIVGTRRASREGIQTAQTFAQQLSHHGLTITSGMAYGIEGASLWGSLLGSGKTIAVAARGLDRTYPSGHQELAYSIAQTGALVSEFPPGTPVKRAHFLRRSRIVSGLTLGTLVVEAPAHSSALYTVRFAAEQGREVFAIPSSIHNPLAKGCHQLIKEGAKLVETVDDIFEELQIYRSFFH
ncbi:MAG: DNA-processing protein DprA [Candidatus Parabeggiatoa sp.]|nr:DNA-processing protein DprA [Candidatus Parabeggiatoa sp.]